jgi:hypothetical protein
MMARAWSGLTDGGAGDGVIAQLASHAISATVNAERYNREKVLTLAETREWRWTINVNKSVSGMESDDFRAQVRQKLAPGVSRDTAINASLN